MISRLYALGYKGVTHTGQTPSLLVCWYMYGDIGSTHDRT